MLLRRMADWLTLQEPQETIYDRMKISLHNARWQLGVGLDELKHNIAALAAIHEDQQEDFPWSGRWFTYHSLLHESQTNSLLEKNRLDLLRKR